jgi:hypothetical protein
MAITLMVDRVSKRRYNTYIDSNKEQNMGYRVMDTVDMMRDKYGPRKGLEGPFNFSGRVLYYDVKEGLYYDPTTDFYVFKEEMDIINNQFMEHFKNG